jgi:hypothetical protein
MSAALINVGMRALLSLSDRLDALQRETEPDALQVGQALTDAYNFIADRLSADLGMDAKKFIFELVVAQAEAGRALDRAKKGVS